MIVTRIQLYCGRIGCRNFYPEDGPMDGSIFSAHMLRADARRVKGWAIEKTRFGMTDVCPNCLRKGKPSEQSEEV